MKTMVWGHRGASHYAPENTLPAFQLAINQKADGIELDVQLSKDKELVVIHDETIDRVSDGRGYVWDYTLKELKQFNVNKHFPQYGKVSIPSLEEVYQLIKPTNLIINVELKTSPYFYPGIEEKVIEKTYKTGMEKRVIFSSFNHYSIANIKALSKDVKTAILLSDVIVDAPSYALNLGVDAIHPTLYYLQVPDLIKESKEKGMGIHVWTVNEEEDIKKLIEYEVEAIITNKPDYCRKIIEKA